MLAFLLLFSASQVLAIELSFSPSSVELAPGERALIALQVDSIPVPGLAAFQVELHFDSSVVWILNPNEAFRGTIDPFVPLGNNLFCAIVRGTPTCDDPDWLLISTGRTPVGADTIDNTTGVVVIAYGTLGEQAPPTGGGIVALLELEGRGSGSTTIVLADTVFADASEPPMRFPVTTFSAQINTDAEGPEVPSVGSLGLGLLAGLLALAPWSALHATLASK